MATSGDLKPTAILKDLISQDKIQIRVGIIKPELQAKKDWNKVRSIMALAI